MFLLVCFLVYLFGRRLRSWGIDLVGFRIAFFLFQSSRFILCWALVRHALDRLENGRRFCFEIHLMIRVSDILTFFFKCNFEDCRNSGVAYSSQGANYRIYVD